MFVTNVGYYLYRREQGEYEKLNIKEDDDLLAKVFALVAILVQVCVPPNVLLSVPFPLFFLLIADP